MGEGRVTYSIVGEVYFMAFYSAGNWYVFVSVTTVFGMEKFWSGFCTPHNPYTSNALYTQHFRFSSSLGLDELNKCNLIYLTVEYIFFFFFCKIISHVSRKIPTPLW